MPERLKMLLEANWETAKEMSVGEMAIVILEGMYNLSNSIGKEVESAMMKISDEKLAEIAETKDGRIVLSSMNEMAHALAVIISSIDQLRSFFPEEYDANVERFRERVDEKLDKREEAFISEFIQSIPDAPPLDDV